MRLDRREYLCACNTYMYLRDRSFISRLSRKEVGAESAAASEMVQHQNVLKAHNGLWFRHEYKSAKGIIHGTAWSRVTPQGPRITVIGNLYSHNTIFRVYQYKKKKKNQRKREKTSYSCALGFIWYGNDWRSNTHIHRMERTKKRPIKHFMLFLLLFYMFGNDRNLTGFYILNNNFSH
jgi:hypothetical protein